MSNIQDMTLDELLAVPYSKSMAEREMPNEEAIEILGGIRACYNIFDEYDEPKYAALSKAIFALKADMGQVKHGRWVKYGSPLFSEWECSRCGERHTGNDLPDRCPHCKARMDGGRMTREEAIRRLEEGAPFSELYDEEWENALVMAIEALKAEPIKHGTWGENIYGYRKCSVCGRVTQVDECMREPLYLYCPYCGSRTDGKDEVEE